MEFPRYNAVYVHIVRSKRSALHNMTQCSSYMSHSCFDVSLGLLVQDFHCDSEEVLIKCAAQVVDSKRLHVLLNYKICQDINFLKFLITKMLS